MKKLIFGLILSVGISGMSLANTQVEQIVLKKSISDSKIPVFTDNQKSDVQDDCSITDWYTVDNCDGTTSRVSYDSVGDCGSFESGSHVDHMHHQHLKEYCR